MPHYMKKQIMRAVDEVKPLMPPMKVGAIDGWTPVMMGDRLDRQFRALGHATAGSASTLNC